MKNDIKTRIWGFFETLAFCGIYYTAVYIARFLMYLFFAVYFAISNYTNHELFHADEFVAEINRAIGASRVELIILADVLMVVLSAIIIYARGGKFNKYTGMSKASVIQIVAALIAGAGIWYVSINVLSDLLTGTQALYEYNRHMNTLASASPILVLVLTVVIAPVTEEIMFRGALFNSLTRMANKPIAIIVTSIIFAAAHGDPVQMGYAFVLGVMLGLLRAESGQLLPCIALHFSFNLMNYFISGYFMPIWLAIVISVIAYALALYKKI